MTKTPIQKAIEIAGSHAALAVAVGVTPPMVWQWCQGIRPISAARCIPIEQATAGAVTRYDLRPDIFGPAPAKEGEAA